MKNRFTWILIGLISPLVLFSCAPVSEQSINEANNQNDETASDKAKENKSPTMIFFEKTMNAAPFLPRYQEDKYITFDFSEADPKQYFTSEAVDYQTLGWEQKIASDWQFFDINEAKGKILLIDIKQYQNKPAYRYLSNNTQDLIYEPWSSSKIFAYTAAMAKLREQAQAAGLGDNFEFAKGYFGKAKIADMITTINSYDPLFEIDGTSNALATFFANFASRDYLSSLFYDEWLKLSQDNIYFRGAYGPVAYEPARFWQSENQLISLKINFNALADEDPGYLTYRCEKCGLTGNKPMTTLAQAEWLKRLAMHSADPSTAHPAIKESDIRTLFYGEGHSGKKDAFAGMAVGISTMLQQAIANAITLNETGSTSDVTPATAKKILDEATNGQWRVFQKIGWGPSETRSSSENVVLAYVTLPNYKGGLAFVVAAQTSVAIASEEQVAVAGMKMQSLLNDAMLQYIK